MSVGNVANWVQQPCTTVGTGTLFLDGSASGAATFAMAIPLGPVWYSILDHATGNREAGIGEYNGADSLVRTEVHATLSDGVYNPDSPSPINLSGNSLVQCTMNAEAFRSEFSPIAEDVVYDQTDDLVADATNVQDALVQHSRGIESSEPSMSGVYAGGILSATLGTAVFSVTVGTGIIYDSYTNPGDTDFLEVSWNEFIDIPLDVSAGDFGIVHIFVNSLGQIIQFNAELQMSMFRDYIFLGNVYYSSVNQIIEVLTAPSVIKQTASNNYDSMFFTIAIKGAEIRAVDAQLQIWNREGAIFFPNINWSQDRKNPNIATMPQVGDSTTPASLDIIDQLGTVISTVTDIPQSYNPTGATVTALVGIKATIHRLYTVGIGANRKLLLLLGQNEYQDASKAVSQLVLDAGNSIVPFGLTSSNLLGHVCVSGTSADFSDPGSAWVSSINQSAGGGVSAPTDAVGISFDNTASGLSATEVQGAIDEVEARTDSLESSGHTHTNSAILDATTASFLTADETKLDGIEAGATADQTTTDLGLENVDNTSDINKPVSTAQQTALDGKVDDAQVLTNVPAGAVFTDTVGVEEAPEDGKDYVRRDANWAIAKAGGSTAVEYVYKTQFGSSPSAGDMQRDAETISFLYCNTLNAVGVDVADLFESMGVGDLIFFQAKADATTRATYEITGLVTRAADVHTVPAILVSDPPDTPIANNAPILFTLESDTGTPEVDTVFGRTGVVVAQSGDYTKAQVGLTNVDDTSDVDKPVSTAQQTALDGKVEEAPEDSQDYVRNNAAWVVSTGGGGANAPYIQALEPAGWVAGDIWIKTT